MKAARNDVSVAGAIRDSMFNTIMTNYLGSKVPIEILSTTEIDAGNNSLSLRRRDLRLGRRRLSVVEKMPSVATPARVGINFREIWLYESFFRDHRIPFTPEFYGVCVDGQLMQIVFEYIDGVRPDLQDPAACRRVLEALARVNSLAVPDRVPFPRQSLSFMNEALLRERLTAQSGSWGLVDFLRNLPAHAARYGGIKEGLSHGDLHRGNLLLAGDGRMFLIDWSRWGAHPVGADIGKYMIGAAYRSNAVPIRELLGGYAEAVGVALDDVICRKVGLGRWELIDTFNRRKMFRIY